MERVIILKNTKTGQALTLPVTPKSYPMAAGRTAERLDMAQTGQITLPGLLRLFSEQLEFMLPAREYPFMAPGATADPWSYIELLTNWSESGDVCRYIVSGTDINSPVLLGPLEYGEQDGTNDVYCKLPLYEYRYLTRASEASGLPRTANTYTVVSGDTLWSICQRFYGDGSLAYKLATANGIKNPNLIHPGQVLTLPDLTTLSNYAATAAAPAAADIGALAQASVRTEVRGALGLGRNISQIALG